MKAAALCLPSDEILYCVRQAQSLTSKSLQAGREGREISQQCHVSPVQANTGNGEALPQEPQTG